MYCWHLKSNQKNKIVIHSLRCRAWHSYSMMHEYRKRQTKGYCVEKMGTLSQRKTMGNSERRLQCRRKCMDLYDPRYGPQQSLALGRRRDRRNLRPATNILPRPQLVEYERSDP